MIHSGPVLILLGIAALECAGALYTLRHAPDPREGRWTAAGVLGVGAWVAAVALVPYARFDAMILWSARAAFIGPAIAAPAFVVLIAFLLNERLPSFRRRAALLGGALLTHAPALLTDQVIASVRASGGLPEFTYGRLAFLLGVYHVLILISSIYLISTRWSSAKWRTRNRLLLTFFATLIWMAVVIVTNQILPIVFGVHHFYLLGPAFTLFPLSVWIWSMFAETLPDLWGALGALFPNTRARFFQAFDELERMAGQLGSPERAVRAVSELLNAQVTLAGAEATIHGSDPSLGLWIAPEGRARLYGRRDPERMRKIIDCIGTLQREEKPVYAAASMATGWRPDSLELKPEPVPWPVGSIGALKVARQVVTTLRGSSILVLICDDDLRVVKEGLRRVMGRRRLVERDYPDRLDRGISEGEELRRFEAGASDLLVFVTVRHLHPAPEFESAVWRLLAAGALVVFATRLDAHAINTSGLLRVSPLREIAVELIECPSRMADAREVSALIDYYLYELYVRHGWWVNLSPGEREALCRTPWPEGVDELATAVERLAFEKSGSPGLLPRVRV